LILETQRAEKEMEMDYPKRLAVILAAMLFVFIAVASALGPLALIWHLDFDI